MLDFGTTIGSGFVVPELIVKMFNVYKYSVVIFFNKYNLNVSNSLADIVGEKMLLTLLMFSHHMTFNSRTTTIGTQDSVKATIIYPKRWATFPSACFFPRSLAPGVRKHTAPTMSGRLLGAPLVEEPAHGASAPANKNTVRRGGSGVPVPAAGWEVKESGGAVRGSEAESPNKPQISADTFGRGSTPRLTTFLRCCLTTWNIRI